MSTQQYGSWSDDDDLEDDAQEQGNSAMSQLRKADRAKAKRIAELEKQLSEVSESQRKQAMQQVLQARSLSPKIAGLIPSDLEPTEDAVSKWLDEYGDVFGIPQSEPSSGPDQMTVAQMRSMDAVGDRSVSVPSNASDLEAKIAGAQTKEELDALIFGGGAG